MEDRALTARLPVVGDDGAVFHLMRRVLQRHGARWSAALPEMTKTQWAVLRAVADDENADQNARSSSALRSTRPRSCR